jgi:shikimate dehydrogenase
VSPRDWTRRCAVVGKPIAHSLSPLLHRAAYAALDLDWTYERFEVSADDLADFVARLDSSWRGLSLTMPLKEAVLGLGEVDPVARRAGAGNTLILDGRRRVYNTDVAGLAWAIRRVTTGPLRRVSILGTGATARSAVVALTSLAAEAVTIVARNPAKAEALAELGTELGLLMRVQPWGSVPPPADLVVAATTAGAVDPMADQIAANTAVVLDIVYAPWPTPLAQAAVQAGRTVISGLDLLVGQALRQIELMTGQSVPPDVLYAALDQNRSQTTGFGA